MVVIENNPEIGKTYTFSPAGVTPESGDEKLTFKVTGISGGNVVCDLSFKNTSVVSGDTIEMIGFDFGTEKWYVEKVSSTNFTYKTSPERVNEDLYFEVKLVSVN